jgi:hypothetical protein
MSVRPAPGRLEHAGAARDAWGLAVVVVLALAVSWTIFQRAIRVGDLLWFDEAYHSLWGLLIADDLLHARFVSLLVDTNRQVYWPPLHSWYSRCSSSFSGRRRSWRDRAVSWRSFHGCHRVLHRPATTGRGRGEPRSAESWPRRV